MYLMIMHSPPNNHAQHLLPFNNRPQQNNRVEVVLTRFHPDARWRSQTFFICKKSSFLSLASFIFFFQTAVSKNGNSQRVLLPNAHIISMRIHMLTIYIMQMSNLFVFFKWLGNMISFFFLHMFLFLPEIE